MDEEDMNTGNFDESLRPIVQEHHTERIIQFTS